MESSKTIISVNMRALNDIEKSNFFETFIKEMNAFCPENKINFKENFKVSHIDSTIKTKETREDNKKAEIMLSSNNVSYVTKHSIPSYDVLVYYIISLERFFHKNVELHPVIVINSKSFKYRLIYREGEWKPSNTKYDLGMVKEKELAILKALNDDLKIQREKFKN